MGAILSLTWNDGSHF